VVLARQADGDPELLLVRRHAKSSFGGAYAFPGGVLERSDSKVSDYCVGVADSDIRRSLGVDDALAYLSAAIRELFEESGVLLATIEDEGCDPTLRCDALHYFSFWITPEIFKARYSTRFFLAAMPEGQTALHCGGELTDSRWVSASAALSAETTGEMPMHFPTIKTLESFAGLTTLDDMLAWASARAAEGVPCILPRIGVRDGAPHVIVDGRDAGALK
jgi:8-oxo-dGTP pyrophosphatase MutT (NUDIX family)